MTDNVFKTGNISVDCEFDRNPTIRAGSDNKIEWACSISKRNKTEEVGCITLLYDSVNLSKIIQVNPSIDDYRSKTTIVGGGNEVQKMNQQFDATGGIAIVYFDGSVFDTIRPETMVAGKVLCTSNYGDSGIYMGNFTPIYQDYTTDTFFKMDFAIDNVAIIVLIVIGILILGIIVSLAIFTWRRGVF